MMAAGVTDHVWTLQELLMYRVPPRAPENIVSIDEGHQKFCRAWPLCRTTARSCPTILGHTRYKGDRPVAFTCGNVEAPGL
jgi:hypothetical protein